MGGSDGEGLPGTECKWMRGSMGHIQELREGPCGQQNEGEEMWLEMSGVPSGP